TSSPTSSTLLFRATGRQLLCSGLTISHGEFPSLLQRGSWDEAVAWASSWVSRAADSAQLSCKVLRDSAARTSHPRGSCVSFVLEGPQCSTRLWIRSEEHTSELQSR